MKSVDLSLLFASQGHRVYGEGAATSAGVATPSLIEIGPGITVATHIVPVKKAGRLLLRHVLQRKLLRVIASAITKPICTAHVNGDQEETVCKACSS